MSKSELEEELLFQMNAVGLQPQREWRFHPVRRWRFDFAFPEEMLAIGVHGGVWTGGRHTRGGGFTNDCEKYSNAAMLGWRIVHVTGTHVASGEALNWIEAARKGDQL